MKTDNKQIKSGKNSTEDKPLFDRINKIRKNLNPKPKQKGVQTNIDTLAEFADWSNFNNFSNFSNWDNFQNFTNY